MNLALQQYEENVNVYATDRCMTGACMKHSVCFVNMVLHIASSACKMAWMDLRFNCHASAVSAELISLWGTHVFHKRLAKYSNKRRLLGSSARPTKSQQMLQNNGVHTCYWASQLTRAPCTCRSFFGADKHMKHFRYDMSLFKQFWCGLFELNQTTPELLEQLHNVSEVFAFASSVGVEAR